ncbi:KN motif and ankyrin repeat domain-containing protein 2 [Morella rubra]|uniref:KN motif and ankyrin repeat domain-containing protein 2 n=1 Tax=Morella rubra TaxID=262757 RepID=A0A6A1V139_9ROSI|nr:KN motif and ankyrin repeat domain-containing protein 2 [Morella rubra]
MEVKATLCGTTLEILHKDNYLCWSVRVKTYLLSQDLWDVIDLATASLKEEDDKATLKAWSKKNFMALHVIQNSCGPESFYEIRKITLAKIAWCKLEEIYNNMPKNICKGLFFLFAYLVMSFSHPPSRVSNLPIHILKQVTLGAVVQEVLNQDNYEHWSAQVKAYLMAHDLWDIVTGTTEPPRQEDNESAFETWREKNCLAVHVIKISCGRPLSDEIIGETVAKVAWDKLAKKCNVFIRMKYSGRNIDWFMIYWPLKFLLDRGDWDPLQNHIHTNMAALNAKVNDKGQTLLHMAVAKGHVQIVERLVELMTEKDLEIQDDSGMTAMSLASALGDRPMLECMHRKNKKLLTIRDWKGRIPLLVALDAGNLKVASYLYSVTTKDDLQQDAIIHNMDSSVITGLIMGNKLDLALDLLRCYRSITTYLDSNGHIPLYTLACRPSAFPSGRQLVFWKKWIYCFRGLLHRLMSNQLLIKLLGIRHIYDMKVLHTQSRKLLELTCKEITSFDICRAKEDTFDTIFRATREGIVEIVREMLRANPRLVEIKDEKSRTIFSLAVLCRQATIWNLLNGLPWKDQRLILFGPADDSGNTILHMAATVDHTSTQLLHNTSAAFQMQRELQWFKEIEEIARYTSMSEELNSENMRPKEIFTRDHKELLKQGEEWMKGTATSCTVVGALIVTIMFAVAFAVPGGNNQDTGLPMFSKDKLFALFIISDAYHSFLPQHRC